MLMRYLSIIGLLITIGSREVKAQVSFNVPIINPAFPTTYAPRHTYGVGSSFVQKGSYQTIDGTWHQAKIELANNGIWIQDIHDYSEEVHKQVVSAATLRLVTLRKDTLELLSAPTDLAVLVENDYLGKQKLPEVVFVRRRLKGAGLALLSCPTGHRGELELVRQQDGRISIVPQKQKLFQEYALALVSDCLQLQQGINTGIYRVGAMEPLLRQYIHWKKLANQ